MALLRERAALADDADSWRLIERDAAQAALGTRSNLAGLTEREAEIARLVAAGLSNAEIAEQLVLSPRTVGHHVSAILAKLDVPRRGSIAAAIGPAPGDARPS
jgi:DNA-binding NarL/FixJ family response regulator